MHFSKYDIGLIFFFAFLIELHARPTVTLEDIFTNRKFVPQKIEPFAFLDSIHGIIQKDGRNSSIFIKNIVTGRENKIFDSSTLAGFLNEENIQIDQFKFLDSGKYLIGVKEEKIYRHSTRATYFYVNQVDNNLVQIAAGRPIEIPTLSSDNRKLAYVLDNDIYILNLKNLKVKRITHDGKQGQIINGKGDWVYEEEFGVTNTLYWSPDNRNLAYLKWDESQVRTFSITQFNSDYPTLFTYKYPLAGEKVSQVCAWIYTDKGKSIPIAGDFYYIPKITWKNNRELAILSLNRFQNELKVWAFDIHKKVKRLWYQESDKRYVEVPQMFRVLEGDLLAITSEKSGVNQLYFINEQGNEKQVTSNNYEVKDVLRIDLEDSSVQFSSYLPTPERESILSLDLKTQELSYLSDTTGVTTVSMLGDGYFLEKMSSQTCRAKISIKSLRNLTSLVLLKDIRTEDSILSKMNFVKFQVEDYTLNGWCIYPPDFDSTKKYPVLFYVYGGPGSQTVKNRWYSDLMMWLEYMAQQGFIILSVDNRGAGGRGAEFKKMTYAKLGQLESDDQLHVVKQVAALPYVDSARIAMFGWSYGGYLTLMCMAKSKGLISKGISVAPVTDWRYYDAVYTERYMRTPISNTIGYDKGSPVELAQDIFGSLLLVHGTGDDNVHYQNSMQLAKRLIYYDKIFQMSTYPDARHAIGGNRTHLQLYRTFTHFLSQSK